MQSFSCLFRDHFEPVTEGPKDGAFAEVPVVENQSDAGGQVARQPTKGAATDGSVTVQTPASMVMIYPQIDSNLADERLAMSGQRRWPAPALAAKSSRRKRGSRPR